MDWNGPGPPPCHRRRGGLDLLVQIRPSSPSGHPHPLCRPLKSCFQFANLKSDEALASHRAEGLEGKPGAVP